MDYIKIADNVADGVMDVCGSAAEIVAAFRSLKKAGATLKGKFLFKPTDRAAGLNIRSVYGKIDKMFTVFERFTREDISSLRKPIVDFERNAVVSSNGWAMLVADIPNGTALEDFKANGFEDERKVNLCWWNAISPKAREVSDYNLASMKRLAVIEKGGELHSSLMAMAECAKAYEFTDGDGCWHTLYVRIGGRFFNIRLVAAVVTAVFKMGNTKVGVYEQLTSWGASAESYPMHIVGLDGGNNSRGLVMPIRTYGGEPTGFVFPVDGTAANAA